MALAFRIITTAAEGGSGPSKHPSSSLPAPSPCSRYGSRTTLERGGFLNTRARCAGLLLLIQFYRRACALLIRGRFRKALPKPLPPRAQSLKYKRGRKKGSPCGGFCLCGIFEGGVASVPFSGYHKRSSRSKKRAIDGNWPHATKHYRGSRRPLRGGYKATYQRHGAKAYGAWGRRSYL